MASAESMDDSFRVRVEKIFGSLSPAPAPAQSSDSPWSLSDDAVEKRKWRREDKNASSARDQTPCSSSFEGLFSKKGRRQRSARRRELDDDDVDGDDDDDGSRDMDREEWEIRSSIGLDNTLDNEEEEDEFDRVAAGREDASERLYMKDVTDRGSYLNFNNVIPNSLNGAVKDARANRHAAIIRLNEDEVEDRKLNDPCAETDTEVKESHAKVSEVSVRPKPILKRKDNSSDSKPKKRVRFDPDCKIDCDQASETFKDLIGTSSMNATDSDDGSKLTDKTSRVPDYILNPSKYTCYSFYSSSEFNEGSNTKACIDLLELIKSSKGKELGREPENESGELPKSVTFIPKKKSGDAKAVNISYKNNESKEDDGKQSLPRAAGFPVGIAVVESQDSEEVTAYEEIEPEANALGESARSQKPPRKYRTQSRSDDSDS